METLCDEGKHCHVLKFLCCRFRYAKLVLLPKSHPSPHQQMLLISPAVPTCSTPAAAFARKRWRLAEGTHAPKRHGNGLCGAAFQRCHFPVPKSWNKHTSTSAGSGCVGPPAWRGVDGSKVAAGMAWMHPTYGFNAPAYFCDPFPGLFPI